MGVFTIFKRLFQATGCLIIAAVMAGSALTSYVDSSPEVQERLKLSVEDAETRVDEEDSFWTKMSALISSWWESDELVAEAEQDKALAAESKKKREESERERRFNESQYSSNDDYYGSSN